MNEDSDSGAFDAPTRRVLGWDVYATRSDTIYMRGRWRIIWFDPRSPDNWRFDGIFNDGVFQIECGPLMLVYVRGDDY